MESLIKQKRQVDERYKTWIKTLKCEIKGCRSGAPPNDPHHVKTVSTGGSDRGTLPLCRKHHNEVGDLGATTFQKKYGIIFKDLIQLRNSQYAQLMDPGPKLDPADPEIKSFDPLKNTLVSQLVGIRNNKSQGGWRIEFDVFEQETEKVSNLLQYLNKNFRILLINLDTKEIVS